MACANDADEKVYKKLFLFEFRSVSQFRAHSIGLLMECAGRFYKVYCKQTTLSRWISFNHTSDERKWHIYSRRSTAIRSHCAIKMFMRNGWHYACRYPVPCMHQYPHNEMFLLVPSKQQRKIIQTLCLSLCTPIFLSFSWDKLVTCSVCSTGRFVKSEGAKNIPTAQIINFVCVLAFTSWIHIDYYYYYYLLLLPPARLPACLRTSMLNDWFSFFVSSLLLNKYLSLLWIYSEYFWIGSKALACANTT